MNNYNVINGIDNKIIKAWTRFVPVELGAVEQLKQALQLPFVTPYICAMPDCHIGQGSTIGSVIPTIGAIVPSFVGVDLGCGMYAVRTNLYRNDFENCEDIIFHAISRNVPNGRTDNGGKGDRGRWHDIPARVREIWESQLKMEYDDIILKNPYLDRGATFEQLGTLGTGNHFIELEYEEKDHNRVWIIIHSGSRGVGARIGNYFTSKAKEVCEQYFIKLPNPFLAYFPKDTDMFKQYLQAATWAQDFAHWNRKIMMERTIESVDEVLGTTLDTDIKINCHHNYVARENHFGQNVLVTRKGAIRARVGDLGIIPGSMGAKSYIVEGKGNVESFTSCSHGAGRAMSRTQAKKTFSLEDHKMATDGVFCLKDETVLDETPGAYKPIVDVMESQKDLVEIKHEVKQFICIKGPEDPDKRRKK